MYRLAPPEPNQNPRERRQVASLCWCHFPFIQLKHIHRCNDGRGEIPLLHPAVCRGNDQLSAARMHFRRANPPPRCHSISPSAVFSQCVSNLIDFDDTLLWKADQRAEPLMGVMFAVGGWIPIVFFGQRQKEGIADGTVELVRGDEGVKRVPNVLYA